MAARGARACEARLRREVEGAGDKACACTYVLCCPLPLPLPLLLPLPLQ